MNQIQNGNAPQWDTAPESSQMNHNFQDTSVERYGMSVEEYDSYVGCLEESRQLCNEFQAFYAANPEYQIEI